MEDKQIDKWLRRRFNEVGWTLIVYYIILNILVMLSMLQGVVRQLFQSGPYGIDITAAAGSAWGYILSITVGLVVLHAWKGRDYWKSEILVKANSMTPAAFFCLLSLCVGSQLVSSVWISLLELFVNHFGLSVMEDLESVSGASDTVSMFLYSSLLAPIAEEILFRGYVLRTLQPFGKRFAIFCSAFLFGIFHGNLLQTPYAFLVGLVLGYVTVEYSIVWAMALHMVNNLVLADLLSRLLEALPEMAAVFLDLLICVGFALAALVILIRKWSQIQSYRRGEWMDRRCLKCFFSCSGILLLTLLMIVSMALLLL